MAAAKGSRSGTIHQISASNGGVPKLPLEQARAFIGGLEGDAQADGKHHGGPERALCLFSLEQIEEMAAEGHPIAPGRAGENVTLSGIDWSLVVPGARLRLGDGVLVEISSYTTPCWKNAPWFIEGDFNRMNQKTNPGCSRVYARVLEEGLLRTGDAVDLLDESAAERVARQQPPTIRWRPPGRGG
ncbi:MAG: MOSC domain-containing protein [Chloroflexi bacterium]|nr:MOSC domain-containing protein [Chloroflexota bacterium]